MYVSPDCIATIILRSFEKVMPGTDLADSVSNVAATLDSVSVTGVPALELINACMLEFVRVEDLREKDEEVTRARLPRLEQKHDILAS